MYLKVREKIRMGSSESEIAEEFRYLNIVMNWLNKRSKTIDQHIQSCYRAYFVYTDILKSNNEKQED